MPNDQEQAVDYASRIRVDGQVYVVFGVGDGIGGQTARALASLGATVTCVDLDTAVAKATATAVGGHAVQADVSVAGEVDRVLADATERRGRLDGVVDIIGAAIFKSFTETTDEDWERQEGLVIRHAFRILRAAAPLVERSGGGSLSFVASIAGLNAAPLNGIYGMFKAAMMSMVRSSAVELGPRGIRVNAVAPGSTNTPRLLATQSPEMRDAAIRSTPLRKAAEASDIAGALAFLASPLAGHITGQTLVVDGGVSLMNWRELTGVGIPGAAR